MHFKRNLTTSSVSFSLSVLVISEAASRGQPHCYVQHVNVPYVIKTDRDMFIKRHLYCLKLSPTLIWHISNGKKCFLQNVLGGPWATRRVQQQ
ncbi:hypothetical protein GDO86_014339 [Hymenochirus boettgeri]|uniref:Secreted protein n=1 Tax=Hymenochirus boettgeri TaxID=247094 RepID=A0A8T2JNQ4_9PIPI|nr:hypothetical protein GDO86_014339 [Hymenochirus boettgeri]